MRYESYKAEWRRTILAHINSLNSHDIVPKFLTREQRDRAISNRLKKARELTNADFDPVLIGKFYHFETRRWESIKQNNEEPTRWIKSAYKMLKMSEFIYVAETEGLDQALLWKLAKGGPEDDE
jgi:hypothetical protein